MESYPIQIIRAENPFLLFDSCRFLLLSQSQCVKIPTIIQIQKPIRCARNKRRRWKSARSGNLMFESAYFIASKLKILPEPLDIVLKEFGVGGGNGGGSGIGFRKGFGWGGFDGWGKRRRRNKGHMKWLGISVISCLCLWLVFGKESEGSRVLAFLGFVLYGLSLNGWRSGLKNWALGFSLLCWDGFKEKKNVKG